jgi:hypothetical protein
MDGCWSGDAFDTERFHRTEAARFNLLSDRETDLAIKRILVKIALTHARIADLLRRVQ